MIVWQNKDMCKHVWYSIIDCLYIYPSLISVLVGRKMLILSPDASGDCLTEIFALSLLKFDTVLERKLPVTDKQASYNLEKWKT